MHTKEKILSLFDDLISYLIIGVILGGRLGYIIFYNLNYYSKNLLEIFMVWKGGMSFHGGLLGVIIATYIFSNRNSAKLVALFYKNGIIDSSKVF